MKAQAPIRAYIGIGANLGDPCTQVHSAIAALQRLPRTTLVACSSLYASAPVDAAGPDYVNAVVALDTSLPALELLRALQAIEAQYGRARSTPNAPRTLDLDVLLYGSEHSDDAQLRLPHPRLHERAFVLQPLLEITPDLAVEGLGPLAPWLRRTTGQRVTRLATDVAVR
jgi:2-amino-4-hydroxy-6-hydroxymethyldihydropteridine diphosphokinase